MNLKTKITHTLNTLASLRRLRKRAFAGGRRPLYAFLAVVLFFSLAASPLLLNYLQSRQYVLSDHQRQLVGTVNTELAKKLQYNEKEGMYQFNAEAQPVDQDINPSEMTPEILRSIVGSEEKQSDMYSLDLPKDGKQGVTFYDTNLKLSFTMKPQFSVGNGREVEGRLVYPLDGAKAVYSVKGNGLKEDILFDESPESGEVAFTYDLQLPKELEARLHDDGSIGVYSGDPALFGNITYGSDDDQLKIQNARETAQKTHLVFHIPAPIIVTNSGEVGESQAWFSLKDNQLTVKARNLDTIHEPFSLDPTVVVTSTSDFAGGNDEYGTNFGTDQISRGQLTGGSIGSFSVDNNFSPSRADHTSVTYNNYIYVIGGYTTSSVQYAPINGDGTIGAWASTTNLPAIRYTPEAVVHNGRVYVVGGSNASTTIYYASFNGDGTLSSWTSATGYTTARLDHATAIYNGYIYVIGGENTDVFYDDVQYAPINGDGTIGTWNTTTSIPSPRHRHASVAHNGYIYILGGWSDTEFYMDDVYYAPINANGTLGSWTATTSMRVEKYRFTADVYDGHIYITGGYNATNGVRTDVHYATINANGTLGTGNVNQTWQLGTSLPFERYRHSSVIHGGRLYLMGGSQDTTNYLQDTIYATINGDNTVGTWSTSPGGFSGSARRYHSTVAYNGYVYILGGYEGSYLNDVQYAPINSDGSIGTWASTTAFTTGRHSHMAAVYNGYMYILGGYSGALQNDVQYAPVNSDGTLGVWSTTTSLPDARYRHSGVVYDGYIYVLGGSISSSIYNNDVLYAAINAGGTIGSWTATSSFSTPRYGQTSAVYNGYVYILGGYQGTADTDCHSVSSSYCSDVQYARINANGTLGTWASTTSFSSTPRRDHTSAIIGGYIYVMGGYGGANLGDVQYAPINSNGTIGSWNTTTSLSTNRYGHTAAAYKGYVYVFGGYDGSYLSDILYSKINDPGATTSYSSTTAIPDISCGILCTATGRSYHAMATYNGYVYIVGGLTSDSVTGDVQYAPINSNGTLGSWAATSTLNTARRMHTAVVYNGRIYAIGGETAGGTTSTSSVEYAVINANGTLGTWNTTTSLPAARRQHASVVHNGYVYVIGGLSNVIYYAPLNSNGTVGTWSTTTSLALSRSNHTAHVVGNYLYVLGGSTSDDPVRYIAINSNGTLDTTWNTGPSPSTGRNTHTSVVYKSHLYFIGGISSNDTTEYAKVNSDGTVGSWAYTSSMVAGRGWAAATVHNEYIYVSGGDTVAADPASTVEYARINNGGSGTTGSYSATTSFTTVRYGHTSVVYNGYLYVIGGYNGSYQSDVQYAPINTNGTIGTWNTTTSFTTARYGHTSVAYNGYLYIIGGQGGSYQSDVQYALINSNGTIGTWNTTTSFTTARYFHTSVAYNGYLYVIGGYNGSFQSGVQYAPISANGTIGTWNTTTSFTTARYGHTSVAYNGYLYVIGGYNNSYQSGVQYALINSNGTIGTWNTTTSFSTARRGHTSVVTGGYLYIIGGYSGSYQSDVQYALINSNGTIGTWNTTTSFTTARYFHTSVAYNGYLYVIGGYNGSYLNDAQYALLNSIPRKARYSKLVDLGTSANLSNITYNGTLLGGKENISFKVAPSSGVFGTSNSAVALTGSCSAYSGRYVLVTFTFDDAQASVYPDSEYQGSITDFSVDYISGSAGGVPVDKRLSRGKYFNDSQALQPLDTLKAAGAGGC